MSKRSKILLTVTAAGVLSLSAVGAIAAQSASSDGDSSGAVTVAQRGARPGNGGAVAEFLGLTPEELREQVSGGATLADVAATQSIDPQALVDDMVAQATTKVQEKVDNGRIDQARADAMIANLSERVSTFVFEGGQHHPNHRGDRTRRGFDFNPLGAMAEFLDLTPQELGEQLGDGATPADVAAAQDIDPQALVDHVVGLVSDRVDEAVEAGTLDADRAAQIVAGTSERITTLVFDGPQERSERHGDRHGQRGARQLIRAAAEVIGIEPADLAAALQSGQTIADVAAANGSSGKAVVDAIVAQADQRLQGAVDNDRITADEKAEKLAQITERVTAAVNTVHEPQPQPADAATSL